MSLPKEELDAIVAELQALRGGQVQRITQPSDEEFVLQLRVPGQNLWLYISLQPPHERLHLIEARPPSLPTPPDFCMVLRKHVMGARLDQIEIQPADRIIQLLFQHKEAAFQLWLELVPRRANLLLCDQDGALVQMARPLPTTRALRRGDLYELPEPPPPRQGSKKVSHQDADSPIVDRSGDPFAFNHSIAAKYSEHAEKQRFDRAKQLALKVRRAERKKKRRLLENLQRDTSRCEAAIAKEQEAELLKSTLHEIPKGAEGWEVVDYYDPNMGKRWIKLDPTMSPQQNLARIFHKIKRARKGLETLGPKLENTELRIMELDEEIDLIEAAQSPEELAPYVVEQTAQQGRSGGKKRQEKALPYHTFTSSDGQRILVGRNSKGNDELSFRVARGNDVWLHVRGIPGSHVVIPLDKGSAPSSEALIDAATLAAHFSKARGERHVDVMRTQAKYVRKPKGAPPGKVSVMRDENIALRVETERLQRLLQPDTPSDTHRD